mgnify:CR=1 FL=1
MLCTIFREKNPIYLINGTTIWDYIVPIPKDQLFFYRNQVSNLFCRVGWTNSLNIAFSKNSSLTIRSVILCVVTVAWYTLDWLRAPSNRVTSTTQAHFAMRTKQNKNATELSKYIWNLKNRNVNYSVIWKILQRCKPYSTKSKKYNLCHPELSSLNSRNELVSTCHHRKKNTYCVNNSFLLYIQQSSVTSIVF